LNLENVATGLFAALALAADWRALLAFAQAHAAGVSPKRKVGMSMS